MSESLKASLGCLILLCVIGAAAVWLVPDMPRTRVVWGLRFMLPLLIVGATALLIWASRRADLAPDFLRQIFGTPFERDGFCFSLVPIVQDGLCYFAIVFQNQYEGACHARVVVQPPIKSFSFGKRAFAGIALDIQCDGGAFGVARAPIAIPAKFQGKQFRFDVSAATCYSDGRGSLLRFKNGLRVGKIDASGLGSAAATIALLAIGVISIKHPAHATLLLPDHVVEELPETARPTIETIWMPGDLPENVAII